MIKEPFEQRLANHDIFFGKRFPTVIHPKDEKAAMKIPDRVFKVLGNETLIYT